MSRRRKAALLVGLAQAHLDGDGVGEIAQAALGGPAPAANGLHAATE